MFIKTIILVISFTLSLSSARVITQNAMSSALQDILSPANTEKALQLIKIAAARSKNASPESRACNCPVRYTSDYLPARGAREMPVRVLTAEGYARPAVVRQTPVREIKVPTNLMDSLVMPKEIFQTFPVALPQEKVPCQSCQACQAYNPYLPIASPVSAMSPGGLPPPTQSRGQFLKKIPIPPPTL